MKSSLLSTFYQTCAEHRERAAVVDVSGSLGFAALASQVNHLVADLHGQGLRQGDVVAIWIDEERRHLLASLALLRLGCPQLTLSSHEPVSQQRALIAKCRAVALVADEAIDGQNLPIVIPDFEAAASSDVTVGSLPPLPDDDTIATLMTGSGTTGTFKVIPVSHRSLMLQARTRAVASSSGVEYIPSSVSFLYPKKHRLRSIVTGYTNLLWQVGHSEVAEICQRFGVDFLRLSPPQVQSLIDIASSGTKIPDGVMVYVGGAPISGQMRTAFQQRQVQTLSVEYGATECGNIAVAEPDMHARYPDGVGRPLAGVRLEIVNEDGQILPHNVEGLIRVRTPGMARGYLYDEELTARMFRAGWFHSGDRGALTEDGVLVFHGRADEMMILNSINIFPAEIEKVAEGFCGVIDCAAFPMRSAVHGDIPMLAVVPGDGCDLGDLMTHCRNHLGLRAPRKVVRVGEIPRNAQGKVLRRELSARASRGEFR